MADSASSVLPTMATSDNLRGSCGSCGRLVSAERSQAQRHRLMPPAQLTASLLLAGLILALVGCALDLASSAWLERAHLQPCRGAR